MNKFFLFRVDTFSEGTQCAGKQRGSHKVVSLVEDRIKPTKCYQFPLNEKIVRISFSVMLDF